VTESPDAAYYADLETRVLALISSVEGLFSPDQVAVLVELAEHNEPAVAVEMLSQMLVEAEAPVTPSLLEAFLALAKTMRLEPDVTDRLHSLVRE
jgi:hypothetical protein